MMKTDLTEALSALITKHGLDKVVAGLGQVVAYQADALKESDPVAAKKLDDTSTRIWRESLILQGIGAPFLGKGVVATFKCSCDFQPLQVARVIPGIAFREGGKLR